MVYVVNIVEFLIRTLDFGAGSHLFNYADKPLMKLPYSIGMVGGYTFDLLSRLSGKKFPISSIRIKKFCASTTVSTHALGAINFKAPFALLEGLKRLIRSMNVV